MLHVPKKLTFVHVYKTGGTSIERALQAAFIGKSIAPIIVRNRYLSEATNLATRAIGYSPAAKHASAGDIRESIGGGAFDQTFSFGIVRNPWDWQVSLYEYMRQSPKHYQHQLVSGMSFEEYIRWRIDGNSKLQQEYIAEEGVHRVDFVGRFENLGEAWARVQGETGISLELPHLNATKRSPYRKYYTNELRALVASAFAPDIEAFGYEF